MELISISSLINRNDFGLVYGTYSCVSVMYSIHVQPMVLLDAIKIPTILFSSIQLPIAVYRKYSRNIGNVARMKLKLIS